MRPLLAHVYEPHRVTYPCYVQPKLNGVRALYQDGHFQSRDELPFLPALLSHLSVPLKALFGPEVILDGELYKHGWPLQRINGAVTPVRQESNEDTLQVEYHVFDRVHFELSFAERQKYAQAIINCAPWSMNEEENSIPIKIVPTYTALDEQGANAQYAHFVSQGYEGMMYRLGDCPYTVPKQQWGDKLRTFSTNPRSKFLSDKDNRCWHLLKRKFWCDDEFICLQVVEGEGKLRGTLGSLRCSKTGSATDPFFFVGSGLTDSERAHYWANPPIGKLIKVKYLVLSSDNIPLNPTILAIL